VRGLGILARALLPTYDIPIWHTRGVAHVAGASCRSLRYFETSLPLQPRTWSITLESDNRQTMQVKHDNRLLGNVLASKLIGVFMVSLNANREEQAKARFMSVRRCDHRSEGTLFPFT
jgi:hypothetical protein